MSILAVQLFANQNNAKKSTGPVTVQGKQTVSNNALNMAYSQMASKTSGSCLIVTKISIPFWTTQAYNCTMNKAHDSSYKFLFSNPEFVRDLVLGFIPDDWFHTLDYETLEKVPGSYITDDFKQREDDIVWRVKICASGAC